MDLKYDAFQEKGYLYLGNLAEPEEHKKKGFEQSAQLSSTNCPEVAKRETEKLAEDHMDFIPETTGNLLQNIDAWLKYWEIDLMLAQN